MKTGYHFELHHCGKGHDHFHIIIGPTLQGVSNPFLSFEAGKQLVQEMRGMIDDDPVLAAFERNEMKRLERQLEELSRTRRRVNGKFARGYMLAPQGGIMPWEGSAYQSWRDFINGKSNQVGYVVWQFGTAYAVPLRCDFVDRPGEDAVTDVRELEKLPVRPRTLEEVGIVLREVKR